MVALPQPKEIMRGATPVVVSGVSPVVTGSAPVNYWSAGQVSFFTTPGDNKKINKMLPGNVVTPLEFNDKGVATFDVEARGGVKITYEVKRGLLPNTLKVTIHDPVQEAPGQKPQKVTLRAQKANLFSLPGFDAPIPLISKKESIAVTSKTATKGMSAEFKGTNFVHKQIMAGDATTGPMMIGVDLSIKSTSWFGKKTGWTRWGGFEITALPMQLSFVMPGRKAEVSVAFAQRLMAQGETTAAIEHMIGSIDEQTRPEFYTRGNLSDADVQLRMIRAQKLLGSSRSQRLWYSPSLQHSAKKKILRLPLIV
jgi:hypothetical protein